MSRRFFALLVLVFSFSRLARLRAADKEKKFLPKVYLDITANGEDIGRIVIELRTDMVPRTAENFRLLCTGEKGLCYKGTPFHRVVRGFMCQGGDVVTKTGQGGKSAYGNKFRDENFKLKHSEMGVVSMANTGKDSNGSQFFMLAEPAPWLDGKHVAFGHVVEGIEVLKLMDALGTKEGRPQRKLVIADCGEL